MKVGQIVKHKNYPNCSYKIESINEKTGDIVIKCLGWVSKSKFRYREQMKYAMTGIPKFTIYPYGPEKIICKKDGLV